MANRRKSSTMSLSRSVSLRTRSQLLEDPLVAGGLGPLEILDEEVEVEAHGRERVLDLVGQAAGQPGDLGILGAEPTVDRGVVEVLEPSRRGRCWRRVRPWAKVPGRRLEVASADPIGPAPGAEADHAERHLHLTGRQAGAFRSPLLRIGRSTGQTAVKPSPRPTTREEGREVEFRRLSRASGRGRRTAAAGPWARGAGRPGRRRRNRRRRRGCLRRAGRCRRWGQPRLARPGRPCGRA